MASPANTPGRWTGNPCSYEARGCVFRRERPAPEGPQAVGRVFRSIDDRLPFVLSYVAAPPEGGEERFYRASLLSLSAAFALAHLLLGAPLRNVPRMSFALTTEQMQAGTKTVTRRRADAARRYYPGDVLLAIEKGQGIPKGGRQTPIKLIEIVSAEEETLTHLPMHELIAEGFPHMTSERFIDMFRSANGLNSGELRGKPARCVRYAFRDFDLARARAIQQTTKQSIR